MRTMILLSAIPGSGKSTWARQYQKSHPNTFIVSSDEIRVQLFGKVNDFSNEALVWKTYLDTINHYADTMDEVTVIADATNLQNKYRQYYRDNTPHFDKHVLILFDIPYAICLIQNKMRAGDRIVPEAAMERLKAEMEPPSPEVLASYDEYIVINDFISRKALKEEKADEHKEKAGA
jgi:predicted kinase